MKIRAILFDLDGTLIDQFDAIHLSFAQTLEQMGFPRPSYQEVKRSVGGASESTMRKLIGPERASEAVEILRPIFEKEMLNGLRALPHVLEGLQSLSLEGISCGVLTNKHGPHARAACNHLGLSKFLKFTIGANDTQWKKPQAELTNYALEKIGHHSSETIYVGDSPYDFETARQSNLRCFLVATGTHCIKELRLLQSDFVYPTFRDLLVNVLQEIKNPDLKSHH